MKRSEKFRDKKKTNDEIRQNPGKKRIFLAVIDIESEKKKKHHKNPLSKACWASGK